MKKAVFAFTLAIMLALTGCGGGGADDAAPAASTSASATATQPQDGPPDCADVLGEGKPVLKETIDDGCMEDDSIVTFVTFDCKDGSTFAASDDWQGRTGATWTKGGAGNASDPKVYSAGVADCTG